MSSVGRPGVLRRSVRWAALLAATTGTWLPIAWLSSLVAAGPPGFLERAEFLAAESALVPAAAADWQPVTLPDDWLLRRPGVREGWYRLRFDAVANDEGRWGIYLPAVVMNAVVYVNGERVGDGGRVDDPVARNSNRTLLLPFEASLLRSGENLLHVRLVSDRPDGGFLPALHVARFHDLAPAHARAELIRRTLLWILVALRLVMAAFTAAIWVMSRKGPYYGWFALSSVAWVIAEIDLMVIDVPIPIVWWYWLFNVAIGWWGIFSVRLVLSFVGVSKPGAERALMIFGIAGSVALGVLAATGSPYFYSIGVKLWLALAFVSSCYLFRGVVPLLRSYPDEIELNVVFVVALSVVGCVLFDLVMQLGLRPRGGLSVPAYGSFFAVSGMGWVLVRRFVGALSESRTAVATLEERVREKHAELEKSYVKIREGDRARVLSAEREQILHDMDEGIGSQLVSTLAMAERPGTRTAELRAAMRAALDDLRLVVDSLEPLDGELLPALGMLRTRLQPRLDAAGIRVEWRVEDLPPIGDLSPHRVLQILRIVQDAFCRALSRSGVRKLSVRAGAVGDAQGGSAFVEIADDAANVDGEGVEEPLLERMRSRAQRIGAVLAIDSSAGGSRVRLSIPTNAA